VEAGVPDPADRLFERYVDEALDALQPDLRARISNVEISDARLIEIDRY
jgi:hypothetical protein